MSRPTTPAGVSAGHHALFWLVSANAVGLLLSLLLLFPTLFAGVPALSFGRLVPLHTHFMLYGWCSLPLVGLLFKVFAASADPAGTRRARTALYLWSIALAIGGMHWMAGGSGGKLFLQWRGSSLLALCGAMCFLWYVLYMSQRGASGGAALIRRLVLGLLLLVPFALFFAAMPHTYPPVNPRSGGATGHSLFISSLGLVLVFLVTPLMLTRPKATYQPHARRRLALIFGGYLLAYLFLRKGNAPNHEPSQILALLSLGAWIPLLFKHYRGFVWPEGARLWLGGFMAWGALLWLNGWLSFLPGLLPLLKFTNGMVAHAHLAMAGLVSSFCLLVITLQRRDAALARRPAFVLWHLGLALQLIALMCCALLEAGDPGFLFKGDPARQLLYGLRCGGGLLMFGASLDWFLACMGIRFPTRIRMPLGPLPLQEEARFKPPIFPTQTPAITPPRRERVGSC